MTARLTAFSFACALLCSTVLRAEDYGLRAPPGFRVTLYADETLANDIYAMTLDKQGRVVVTSQGWIKILHDTQGAGKADKATVFAATPAGGMGLCFDGDDLYFCGDDWFSRYRDSKGRGQADGPPEHISPLRFGEHGGHAVRKGPDGCWYVLGGNSSEFNARSHVKTPSSPIREPEAGALLRFTPDCQSCEVIAHGFRNPYDFDFNEAGDLFTYDSDNEEDFFLPWYDPTRVFHIGYGGHHGWRLNGIRRSWGRPDDYLDTVDILWPVGRGSPTGVVCYRHDQFPEHYRGGVFALDWTFGKVYFFPLQPDGPSYRTKAEVFLEAVGTSGFDPTDVVVGPDGALYISMGGRGTRGAVYRIDYVGDGKTPLSRKPAPTNDLEAVLRAPQPLDAWSREKWMPLARKLGAAVFTEVVTDEKRDDADRMRAVEVLTELFGGLPAAAAKAGTRTASTLVRARVAWSLGRLPCEGAMDLLAGLAEDPHSRVRCHALAALADRYQQLPADRVPTAVVANLASSEKRVRQAAAHLASRLPEAAWTKWWHDRADLPLQARLTAALAAVWRHAPEQVDEGVLEAALSVLKSSNDTDLRLQALRLIILGLGDFQLKDPAVEVYSAYSVVGSLRGHEIIVKQIVAAIRPLLPSGNDRLDEESARLLAILEADDADLPGKITAFWTEKTSPTHDMHYLIVYSRLRGKEAAAQVAQAILGLDGKLRGQQQRNKQNWSVRLTEVLKDLLTLVPGLADELLRDPRFVTAAHVPLALVLDPEHRQRAARLFLDAVRKDTDFAWSPLLVNLLGQLPASEVLPLFREQWSNFGLRDALLSQFATHAEEADRDKFLAGLSSAQQQVVQTCLTALETLPRDPTPNNLVPLLRLVRQIQSEPTASGLRLRTQALVLINRQSGQAFAFPAESTDSASLKRSQQPLFDWFEKQYPMLAATLNGSDAEDASAWDQLLRSVDWSKGEAKRGATLFRDRACVACHAGPSRLGPDLTGVASRFSRDDLFTAIIYPSRDVAPAYRVTVVEIKAGQSYAGIVAYESAETVILQTGATTTMRIPTTEIASRQPSQKSLMPDGLLKDLKPDDLADLYSYLQTLKGGTSSGR
jgi:putative membrane-bound dehydrogenase-like protein